MSNNYQRSNLLHTANQYTSNKKCRPITIIGCILGRISNIKARNFHGGAAYTRHHDYSQTFDLEPS